MAFKNDKESDIRSQLAKQTVGTDTVTRMLLEDMMPGSEIKDSLSLTSPTVARGSAFLNQFFQAPVPTRQCKEGQTET